MQKNIPNFKTNDEISSFVLVIALNVQRELSADKAGVIFPIKLTVPQEVGEPGGQLPPKNRT